MSNIVCLVVVDTSYLLELFAVPGCSTDAGHEKVKALFSRATAGNNEVLFVPVPVLFELANHIADVKDGTVRRNLANLFREIVEESLSANGLFTITPLLGDTSSIQELLKALVQITEQFQINAASQLGLTDNVIIMEAKRLREKYANSSVKSYKVHIWTLHMELKAHEPDTEVNAFVHAT